MNAEAIDCLEYSTRPPCDDAYGPQGLFLPVMSNSPQLSSDSRGRVSMFRVGGE